MSRRSAIEAAIRRLAPQVPGHELKSIADLALDSRGLRSAAPETAAWLAMVAYVRHVFTDYDELLRQGYEQESARFFVAAAIDDKLREWGVRRRLTAAEG